MDASNNYQRLLDGLCTDCENPLEHGQYTPEQIKAAAVDIGMPVENFADVCDDCFVMDVAGGDAKYAASLLGRPVKLRRPGLVFRALLGVS